jgi:hypothetical protein
MVIIFEFSFRDFNIIPKTYYNSPLLIHKWLCFAISTEYDNIQQLDEAFKSYNTEQLIRRGWKPALEQDQIERYKLYGG